MPATMATTTTMTMIAATRRLVFELLKLNKLHTSYLLLNIP